MPIWLRKFTYRKLKDYYEKQNQPKGKGKVDDPSKIFGPAISQPPADYVTKTKSAAKK